MNDETGGPGGGIVPFEGDVGIERLPSGETHELYQSVARSLSLAASLQERGVLVNNQPFIVGDSNWEDFFGLTREDFPEPGMISVQTGIVGRNTVFTTTRDAWDKYLNAPKVTGKLKVRGDEDFERRVVQITANSVGGSIFNHEVLPGVRVVSLWDDGVVTCWRGEFAFDATVQQLMDLGLVFDGVSDELEALNLRTHLSGEG